MPLVYVCGVHGAGKTTLIRNIEAEKFSVTLLPRFDLTFQDDANGLERAMLRSTKYAIEYFRALKHPHFDKNVFIGDRCIYDTLAYVEAYNYLDWIDKYEYYLINQMIDDLFRTSGLPKNVIHLSPRRDLIESNLDRRTKTECRGWKEDNMEYLQSVIDGYEKVFSIYDCNLLKLDCNGGTVTMGKLASYFETIQSV